jgi:hypothetical protein
MERAESQRVKEVHETIERTLCRARQAAIEIGLEVDSTAWELVAGRVTMPSDVREMARRKVALLGQLAYERQRAIAEFSVRIRDILDKYDKECELDGAAIKLAGSD